MHICDEARPDTQSTENEMDLKRVHYTSARNTNIVLKLAHAECKGWASCSLCYFAFLDAVLFSSA